ncbi:Cobalt-precorrin-8x methylmutase [Klebsiella michiganensis]|uniref:Cobalt-precorrin-8x methylmutase n=1 Tax=Klebsiella michiganensis TaxID=1134687 RepID=A0A7H4PIS3_9ENTR|nr:Cobalt-precorrin-8x methylmutase [Klebsiella michiganensis]
MHYIQQPQAIEAKSFDIIGDIIAQTRPDYRFASPLHESHYQAGNPHHR